MSDSVVEPGCLYVVATPIGCLSDMSERAVAVLSDVDLIAAEDTRHSQGLLQHFGIGSRLVSLHEHNEESRIPVLLERLNNGEALALISDAGTPLISDPGYRLVGAAHDAAVRVVPVPGPSALVAALSVSGLATDRFWFEGFLPAKSSARRARLEFLKSQDGTLVIYESSHRIVSSLDDMLDVFGGMRQACLARELTKRFETVRRDRLDRIVDWVKGDDNQRRGEFVVMVNGLGKEQSSDDIDLEQMITAFRAEVPPSKLAKIVAKLSGRSKSEIYALIQDLDQ